MSVDPSANDRCITRWSVGSLEALVGVQAHCAGDYLDVLGPHTSVSMVRKGHVVTMSREEAWCALWYEAGSVRQKQTDLEMHDVLGAVFEFYDLAPMDADGRRHARVDLVASGLCQWDPGLVRAMAVRAAKARGGRLCAHTV